MTYKEFSNYIRNEPLRNIVVCEPREHDDNCWYLYVRMKSGYELRLAAGQEEEARRDCAEILRWRDHPGSIPVDQPVVHTGSMKAIAWSALFMLLLAAAVFGTMNYSLILGWAYTSHFFGGFSLSLLLFTAFSLSIAPKRFELKFYLLGFPLILLLTIILTLAGKTANALFGTQETIHVKGPVTRLDDDSGFFYFPKGSRTVPYRQCIIMVLDKTTEQSYRIEVPGWVADRERLTVGTVWEDEFYRGLFGWLYRRGTNWDSFSFVPKADSWADHTTLPPQETGR